MKYIALFLVLVSSTFLYAQNTTPTGTVSTLGNFGLISSFAEGDGYLYI